LKRLKMLMLVTGFTLLGACGKEPADKFVGEWVDPRPPKVEDKKSWFGPDDPLDVIIKPIDDNRVEITRTMLRREMKNIFEVKENNILSTNKILYTLEGDQLIDVISNVKLVRKK